jgi:CTP:phosphocholine cytidylyltransferase-like protein
MWTMLQIFGSPQIVEDLRGLRIHRIDNIITINAEDRDSMDCLLLWFEPTVRISYFSFSPN